jgi:hypothetical protein
VRYTHSFVVLKNPSQTNNGVSIFTCPVTNSRRRSAYTREILSASACFSLGLQNCLLYVMYFRSISCEISVSIGTDGPWLAFSVGWLLKCESTTNVASRSSNTGSTTSFTTHRMSAHEERAAQSEREVVRWRSRAEQG